MPQSVLMICLCLFAVYGAVKLVFVLYGFFSLRKDGENVKRHTVLFFKDSQDEAEVLIRETVLGRNPFCGDIIAVDRGSKDETMSVLRRLEKEYDLLRVMNIDEYINLIKE